MTLSLGQKAGWGLADLGIVVFVIVKQLLVLTYLTAYLGVPVGIAGFVTTAVLVFDMVTDPLIGYLSDRTQSRFGRRAPWMAIGVVVMALGMVGLFAAPVDGTIATKLSWVIGFFGMATIGFTMVAIPYGAQSGEITEDPKARSTMSGFRMGFASVGILIGGAVIPGLAAGMGYAMAALVVSPAMIGAVWLSLWATRKAPRGMAPAAVKPGGMFGLVFANRAFMVLVGLYGVMTLAIAMITAGLPFAALYLILDNGQTALSGAAAALTTLSLMFAAFVLGSILSQAVWVLLSHRLGKVAALALGLGLYVVLLYVLYTLLPSQDVTLIAAVMLLAGVTNGSYQQIPWAIYPDLMDVTRRDSGMAIEGAFSAVWLFGQKLANALAPALVGVMLSLAGWQETVAGAIPQPAEALAMLQLAITVIPAGILVLAALGLWLIYRPMAARALG